MTKKPESVSSQMKRLGHAIELEESQIVNDGLKAIVKSDSETKKSKD